MTPVKQSLPTLLLESISMRNLKMIFVARIAADDYKDIAKTKVSRVTFLDPASPTCDFSGKEQGGLISVHYVDAHHTNMGGLGTRETLCGGLDIFYNGGSHQPGCPVANPPTLSSG